MTKKELQDWINWAENEKQEYKDFIRILKQALKLKNL